MAAPHQVRRLAKRYQLMGLSGLISKKRVHASNRRLDEATRTLAIELIGTHYCDFGPTPAREKLAELHGLPLSVESASQIMIVAGYWQPKKGGTVCAYPMRCRRARFGEMIQNAQDADPDAETQFARAVRELGTESIHAHSPQAKERVVRANQTLQDRLVKEMRLAGINLKTAVERCQPFDNARCAGY